MSKRSFAKQDAYSTQARILEIVDHAKRVLRKFPYNTVPEDLKWIVASHNHELFHRIGKRGIRLVVVPMWDEPRRRSLPLELLDAPEQDIHKWARESYWTGVNQARQRQREQASKRLQTARKDLEEAKKELERARVEFAILP